LGREKNEHEKNEEIRKVENEEKSEEINLMRMEQRKKVYLEHCEILLIEILEHSIGFIKMLILQKRDHEDQWVGFMVVCLMEKMM